MHNPLNSIRRTPIAINMTPMIDVTFLLIIFFLVSSHLSKQENNVKLNLPIAENALTNELILAQQSVTLNVLENGEIKLGANPIDRQQLASVLGEKNAQVDGKLQVRIRCGEETPYGQVGPILRQLVAAEVTDVIFAVFDDKSGGQP